MAFGTRFSHATSRALAARLPTRIHTKTTPERAQPTAALHSSNRTPKSPHHALPREARSVCGSRSVQRRVTRLQARRVDSPILPPTLQLGQQGEEMLDLYSYLLRNRIVFLGGFVDFEMATKIVGSILALDALDEEEDIKLYINSPGPSLFALIHIMGALGGSIYAVLGVVDVLKATKANVSTVAFGITGGNASLILAAGTKGKRYAMPSSRILLQQPGGYIAGNSVEANITATELNRSLQVITHLYAEFTDQSVEQMEMETNRENFLSPEEAVTLRIIDAVV